MSITSAISRNDYIGNGAVATYSYTFRILSGAHLLVTSRVIATGVETTLALTTDYTVSGVGNSGGGSITLVAGNLAATKALSIRRIVPLLQGTDIRNQGSFLPETHEDAFDYGIMVGQQQQDQINRSLKLPETESGSLLATTIPISTSRASKLLGFDSLGNPIVYAPGGGTVGPGTTNRIAKFTLINAIGDSLLSEAGGNIILNSGKFEFPFTGTAALPSIYWAGDPSTGIYTDSLGSIKFSISGVERFRIYAVVGGAAATVGSQTNPAYTFIVDGDTGMYHPAEDIIGWTTNSTEKMRLDGSGFLGLGVTNPSSIFDLLGSFTQRGIAAPAVSPSGQGRIYFDSTSNTFKISQHGGAYANLVGGGAAGGADTQVQFNDGGVFGGDAGLVFDKTNNRLGIGSVVTPLGIIHAKAAASGDLLTRFETETTGDNPTVDTYQVRIATTDATLTTMITIPLDDDSVTSIFFHKITGRRTGGVAGTAGDTTAFAGYIVGTDVSRPVILKRTGGGAPVKMRPSSGVFPYDMGGSDNYQDNVSTLIELDVSGNNLVVRVKGDVNNNYTWQARYTVEKFST